MLDYFAQFCREFLECTEMRQLAAHNLTYKRTNRAQNRTLTAAELAGSLTLQFDQIEPVARFAQGLKQPVARCFVANFEFDIGLNVLGR